MGFRAGRKWWAGRSEPGDAQTRSDHPKLLPQKWPGSKLLSQLFRFNRFLLIFLTRNDLDWQVIWQAFTKITLQIPFYGASSSFSKHNSHAVGKAVARPYGFKIDFARNLFSGSAAWFFVIIFKFIFTPIFEIKFHEKIFWHRKKLHF